MADITLTERQKKRVSSILRQHSLLFGEGLAGYDPAVRDEAAEILASLDALDAGRAARAASILRQHAMLFGAGIVLDGPTTRREDVQLVRALESRAEEKARGPDAILPAVEPVGSTSFAPHTATTENRRYRRHPRRESHPTVTETAARPYPLQGRQRPTRIAEKDGLVVIVRRAPSSGGATIVLVPLSSIVRSTVDREPVELWVRGVVHLALLEPFRGGFVDHPEWLQSLGDPPAVGELLLIGTESRDRICLGMRPRTVRETTRLTLSTDGGSAAYVFPADQERYPGLTGFLARTFGSVLRIGPSDADGTAYFAVRRVVGRA